MTNSPEIGAENQLLQKTGADFWNEWKECESKISRLRHIVCSFVSDVIMT